MITKGFSETAGSCGYFAPNREGHKTPIDKICDSIKTKRQVKKVLKELKEIDEIQAKAPEKRTLEEKIKLVNNYGNVLLEKLPEPQVKYVC